MHVRGVVTFWQREVIKTVRNTASNDDAIKNCEKGINVKVLEE